ncbi:MAG: cell division protein FtsX [Ignavibacteria bacterium]
MRILFLLKESLSGYRRYKLSFFLTVFSIFIAISLLGFFAYLFINAQLLVNEIRNRVQVEAFFYNYVSESKADSLINELYKIEGISKVNYISKEKAKQRFIKETGIDFKEVLNYNPLPASITIEIQSDYLSKEYISNLRKFLIQTNLISDVIYNQEFLDEIEARTSTFQKILIIIFTIVSISTILLVSNTIRLAMQNKIDVINTMRLVGATHLFIELPFLIEGIIVGFLGSLFAALFVYGLHILISKLIIIEVLITKRNLILLLISTVIFGSLIGFLGSFFTIKKFLKESAFPK